MPASTGRSPTHAAARVSSAISTVTGAHTAPSISNVSSTEVTGMLSTTRAVGPVERLALVHHKATLLGPAASAGT